MKCIGRTGHFRGLDHDSHRNRVWNVSRDIRFSPNIRKATNGSESSRAELRPWFDYLRDDLRRATWDPWYAAQYNRLDPILDNGRNRYVDVQPYACTDEFLDLRSGFSARKTIEEDVDGSGPQVTRIFACHNGWRFENGSFRR
jgi:hypothetical protein